MMHVNKTLMFCLYYEGLLKMCVSILTLKLWSTNKYCDIVYNTSFLCFKIHIFYGLSVLCGSCVIPVNMCPYIQICVQICVQ